jgi:hypothetical protein
MTHKNVVGTEYGFDGSSSWKEIGTQFRAVGMQVPKALKCRTRVPPSVSRARHVTIETIRF